MTLIERGDNQLRVLGISGSLRKASFYTGLLRASQELARDGMEIGIFDIRDIPFYGGDLEAEYDSVRWQRSNRLSVTPPAHCWPRRSTTGAHPGR